MLSWSDKLLSLDYGLLRELFVELDLLIAETLDLVFVLLGSL